MNGRLVSNLRDTIGVRPTHFCIEDVSDAVFRIFSRAARRRFKQSMMQGSRLICLIAIPLIRDSLADSQSLLV